MTYQPFVCVRACVCSSSFTLVPVLRVRVRVSCTRLWPNLSCRGLCDHSRVRITCISLGTPCADFICVCITGLCDKCYFCVCAEFVLSGSVWPIYFQSSRDPCAVFGCNNDHLFLEKYTIETISNTKLEKGDHYYIITRHKDLFSHYNLILRKL